MAILNKTNTIDKLNTSIDDDNSDNLKPTTTIAIKHSNLAAYLNNLLDWIFKPTITDLRGKVLSIGRTTTTNTDYSNISFITMIPLGGIMMYGANGGNINDLGTIKAKVGVNELEGFLFLDGTTIDLTVGNNSRYRDLKTLLDGSYGNSITVPNTLYLPNMKGRVPLGYDNTTTGTNSNVDVKNYQNCGNIGGSTSVKLESSNIPKLDLIGATGKITDGNYLGDGNSASNGNVNPQGIKLHYRASENQQIPVQIFGGSVGSSFPIKVENRMEYMVVNYIIRYI